MYDAKGKKIVVVCTFGAGSSQLLKLNIEKVFKELGVKNVDLEVCDSGSYRGLAAEGIITTITHEEMVKGHPTAKAYASVKGIYNMADIKEKVQKLMLDLGVIPTE